MRWIWNKDKNDFVEFALSFPSEGGSVTLRISADYRYAAFCNEALVSHGQYADLPSCKSVNAADLTPFVRRGVNELRVIAWHASEDCFVCRATFPAVAFEVAENGRIIAQSGQDTRCRRAAGYGVGDRITPQLGVGFSYDFTAPPSGWENATEVDTDFTEADRPVKQTQIFKLTPSRVCAQGVWQSNGGTTAAEVMQNAYLSTLRFWEMTGKERTQNDGAFPLTLRGKGEHVFVIFDLGEETCGYLGFCVTVNKECKMYLGWGEHLSDLRVRTSVGGRNFGMEFTLKKGENAFDDYLMRLGGRYLCLFMQSDEIEVSRLGLKEVRYPFACPPKDFGDRLLNKIYEVGRRTLSLSAHEHYEDCPWREQALYGMDSRNQMLFGYGAFGEYDFPRANLMLMARSMQEDGLIPLCAPARNSISIPSFSAYWLIAIGENAEADCNEAFLREILPYAERCLLSFQARENEWGLSQFADKAYWNFHEWSSTLDGGTIWREEALTEEVGDCILTALVSIAAAKIATVEQTMGRENRAEQYRAFSARLRASLDAYYDEESGDYASYLQKGTKTGKHEYTQAAVLLAGVDEERAKALCAKLKTSDEDWIPETLACLQIKYAALMQRGEGEYCVEDVVKIFGKMLFDGATSYWETERGEADFGDAGSLCHGWSAVACWVLDKHFSSR